MSRLDELAERFGVPPAGIEALRATLALQAEDPAASTTVRAPAQAVDRHVADSLVALELPEVREAQRIADLGSGAGWPGLALAALPVLCEYAAPLLAEGGALVAWKGLVDPAEAQAGAAAAALLGLEPSAVRAVDPYPEAERRTLHVFRKTAPTPDRFPRRPGMAVKRPLA